jgi:hypothetical protein
MIHRWHGHYPQSPKSRARWPGVAWRARSAYLLRTAANLAIRGASRHRINGVATTARRQGLAIICGRPPPTDHRRHTGRGVPCTPGPHPNGRKDQSHKPTPQAIHQQASPCPPEPILPQPKSTRAPSSYIIHCHVTSPSRRARRPPPIATCTASASAVGPCLQLDRRIILLTQTRQRH